MSGSATDVAIAQAVDALHKALTAYSPKALAIAESVARVEGVQGLIAGVVALCIAIGFIWFAFWLLRLGLQKPYGTADHDLPLAGCVISFVVATISMLVALLCLLDPWTWVAIFQPGIYLMGHLLGQV
jgi:hypothetical protein